MFKVKEGINLNGLAVTSTNGTALTVGAAVAATNTELLLSGVVNKAARIGFNESGANKWLIGNGAASEQPIFEIYNSIGKFVLRADHATSNITLGDTGTTTNILGTLTVNGAAVGAGGTQWTTSGANIYYNAGSVGIGGTSYPSCKLYIESTLATAGNGAVVFYKSDAGSNYSHIHYGAKGDWYIRSAANDGNVIIQDQNATAKVGIGTQTPTEKLTVIDSSAANPIITSFTGSHSSYTAIALDNVSTGGTKWYAMSTASTHPYGGGNLSFYNEDSTVHALWIKNTGYIGIGTTSPSFPLSVKGLGPGNWVSEHLSTGLGKTLIGGRSGGGVIQGADTVGAPGPLSLNPDGGSVVIPGALNVVGGLTINGIPVGTGSGSQWINGGSGAIYYASGNIGLGTSTPGQTLHVYNGNGALGFKTAKIDSNDTANGTRLLISNSGNAAGNNYGFVSGGTILGVDKFSVAKLNTDSTYTNISLMTFDSAGNVGINTTSPLAKLDIKGDTSTWGTMAKIYLTDSNATANSRNWYIGNGGSAFGSLTFGVSNLKDGDPSGAGGTMKLVIDLDGNVGLGVSAPAAKLDIALTGTVSLASATITKSTDFNSYSRIGFNGLANNNDGVYFGMGANGTGIPAGIGFFREANGWNTSLAFYTNNITSGPNGTSAMQEKMRITSAGNVGIGTIVPNELLHLESNLPFIELKQTSTSGNTEKGIKFSDKWGQEHIQLVSNLIDDTNGGTFDSKFFIKTAVNGVLATRFTIDEWGNIYIAGNTTVSNILTVGGVNTKTWNGYDLGSSSWNCDITVTDDSGTGTVFKVEAGYSHMNISGYGCLLDAWVTTRGAAVTEQFSNQNMTSGNGGSFTCSKPNTTTFRVTHNAGVYGGAGRWWVRVTWTY